MKLHREELRTEEGVYILNWALAIGRISPWLFDRVVLRYCVHTKLITIDFICKVSTDGSDTTFVAASVAYT